jgi:phage-related protein
VINWIKNVIHSGEQKLLALAQAAVATITGVFSFFYQVGLNVSQRWAQLLTDFTSFYDQLEYFAQYARIAVWRIVWRIIPNNIKAAISSLSALVGGWVNDVRNFASGIVSDVRNWAQTWINTVRNDINRARDWIWGYVSPVLDWLSAVGNRVADIVLHPDKLAAWVVPALLSPVLAYAESQGTAIGRWLLAKSAPAIARAAPMIESVIAKIL